jgi:hypothetical protein
MCFILRFSSGLLIPELRLNREPFLDIRSRNSAFRFSQSRLLAASIEQSSGT